MEELGILDPLDERHIFALHFVTNINYKLEAWREAWGNHRIRTERRQRECSGWCNQL